MVFRMRRMPKRSLPASFASLICQPTIFARIVTRAMSLTHCPDPMQVDINGHPTATVHGDLRPHNILVRRSAIGTADVKPTDVRFVGFERAGFHGVSVYPPTAGTEKFADSDSAPIPRGRLVMPGAPMHQAEDAQRLSHEVHYLHV